MRLKIQIPAGSREELMSLLDSKQATVESQDLGFSNNQVLNCKIMCLVCPQALITPDTIYVSGRHLEALAEARDSPARFNMPLINSLASVYHPCQWYLSTVLAIGTCPRPGTSLQGWLSELSTWRHGLQVTLMCLIEPGAFREMHSFVQKSCDGSGRLEVISLAAIEDVHAEHAQDSLPSGPKAAPEQQWQPHTMIVNGISSSSGR